MADGGERRRPARPTGITRAVLRAPVLLYRWRLGWLLGGRFLLLEHVGRVSGAVRRTVLEVVDRDDRGRITVASGWGTGSQWYRNLRAHPEATIQVGRRRTAVTATFPDADDAAPAFVRYAGRHPRAARALAAYLGAGPVDGSPESLRAAAHHIPWVRFVPRPGD
jgi:deazaflavin-dependent oxidoreductase (nitroreductase family)